jgi:hypothetical protein
MQNSDRAAPSAVLSATYNERQVSEMPVLRPQVWLPFAHDQGGPGDRVADRCCYADTLLPIRAST